MDKFFVTTSSFSFSTAMTDSKNRPAVTYIKSLLQSVMRVHCDDGRIFLGEFRCVDKECNIIFTNAEEFRSVTSSQSQSGQMKSRFVAMIMIPRRIITKIEATAPPTNGLANSSGGTLFFTSPDEAIDLDESGYT